MGYGGVVLRDNTLIVVSRGTNWQLMAKELVKGTAELICLHGLNTLDEFTYRQVMAAADGIDFEPWMLQTGGELWRHVLAVLPEGSTVAEMLMHLARLPATELQNTMLAIIEQPDVGRRLVARLFETE